MSGVASLLYDALNTNQHNSIRFNHPFNGDLVFGIGPFSLSIDGLSDVDGMSQLNLFSFRPFPSSDRDTFRLTQLTLSLIGTKRW